MLFDITILRTNSKQLTSAAPILSRIALESVRKVSFGIAQLSQHQPDRGKLDKCESGTVQVLEILGQPAAAVEPREVAGFL